jgi:hypothetical protein
MQNSVNTGVLKRIAHPRPENFGKHPARAALTAVVGDYLQSFDEWYFYAWRHAAPMVTHVSTSIGG